MKEVKKQNQVIESKNNLNEKVASIRVNSFLKQMPSFENGYILANCPDICDLFIVEKKKIRKCTGFEWAEYFRTYLFPVE